MIYINNSICTSQLNTTNDCARKIRMWDDFLTNGDFRMLNSSRLIAQKGRIRGLTKCDKHSPAIFTIRLVSKQTRSMPNQPRNGTHVRVVIG